MTDTANVRKNKKSAYWDPYITGPDGIQRQISTALTGKAGAFTAAVAAEWALKKLVTAPINLGKRLADWWLTTHKGDVIQPRNQTSKTMDENKKPRGRKPLTPGLKRVKLSMMLPP